MVDLQPLLPGESERIGSVQLAGRLHVGERGRTYLGHSSTDQLVVVRLLDPAWIRANHGRMPLAMRLVRARLVDSPLVARVIDAQLGGRDAFVVAEYVEGPTLTDVIRSRGPLPAESLRHLAIRVLAGLVAVHEVGLVYGDLAPEQVRFGPDGAQLIDLGLAAGSASVSGDISTSQPLTEGADRILASGADHEGLSTSNVTAASTGSPRSAGLAQAGDVLSWARNVVYAATGRFTQAGENRLPGNGDCGLELDLADADLLSRPGSEDLERAVRACLNVDPSQRPPAAAVLATLTGRSAPVGAGRRSAVVGAGRRSESVDAERHVSPGTDQEVAVPRPVDRATPDALAVFDVRVPAARQRATFVRETVVETVRVAVESGSLTFSPGSSDARTVVMDPPLLGREAPSASGSEPAHSGPATLPWRSTSRTPPHGTRRVPGRPPPGRSTRRRRALVLAGVAGLGMVVGWFLGAGALAQSGRSSGGSLTTAAPAPASGAGVGASAGAGAGAGTNSGDSSPVNGAASVAVGAAESGCKAEYRVVEQWPGGFKGQVSVTAGPKALTGWRLRWTFADGQAISQWWNVAVVASGSSVLAQNSATNGAIQARGTTTFVFLGTYRDANPPPPVSCSPA